MSDFNPMLDTLARQQIQERVATHRRETLPGPRRPHGRHAWPAGCTPSPSVSTPEHRSIRRP